MKHIKSESRFVAANRIQMSIWAEAEFLYAGELVAVLRDFANIIEENAKLAAAPGTSWQKATFFKGPDWTKQTEI